MGDIETGPLGSVESLVKYHPEYAGNLTCIRDPDEGHCLAGSLTGAVASQTVTEACEGKLRTVRNRS